MKNSGRIKAVFFATVLAAIAVVTTGCRAPIVKSLVDGAWVLDIRACDEPNKVSNIFVGAELSFSDGEVSMNVEYTDDFKSSGYSCNFVSGSYRIESFSSYGADELNISLNWDTFFRLNANDGKQLESRCVVYDTDGEYMYITILRFSKNGSGFPPVTEELSADKIKSAYANAGYDVDIEDSELDESTAALVKQMKAMYDAMGYDISVIGKNTGGDDIQNMELYMLFDAPTESDAKELENTLKDAYQCKRAGKLFIAYIMPIGAANFEPFDTAVK